MSPVPASPADSTGSAVPRTRRFHNKSRAGCRGCKERRIKCDEGRPICSNCIRRSAACEYEKQAEEASDTPTPTPPPAENPAAKSALRPRKTRRRNEADAPSKFTFVDVNKSIAKKRKRDRSDDGTVETTDASQSNSPATTEDAEIVVGSLPVLSSAVETALEQGQRLAGIIVVSKQSTLLRGENEYIPRSTTAPVASGDYSDFNKVEINGFTSHPPGFGYSSPRVASSYSPVSSISLWQSSPSTGLRQGGVGVKISLQDFNLINTYRNFTCQTFPYVTPSRNPWKALTFDLQFKNPYLYHTTIAITAAHVRYLQGVAIPSLLEVSHYVKGLSSYRECLASYTVPSLTISKTGEIPVESQGLFATSALLGAYMWAAELTDIHNWLIAKFSMTVGTREIIDGVWEANLFTEFREAVGESLQKVTTKLHEALKLGSDGGVMLPALEALATGQAASRLLLPAATGEIEDTDAPAEEDGEIVGALGPEIYDITYAWVDREECPFYKTSNGSMVSDIGSLHRLVCIITALEAPEKLSDEAMIALVRMISMWPGLCCHVVLEKLKEKDKRVYLLLAYYYAAVVKMKQVNIPTMHDVLDEKSWSPPADEVLRSWWLIKNPRIILRSIIDWLGEDWVHWLEWPLKVLREEEESERVRIETLWEPTATREDMSFA
ncbi:hypothetical protein AOL_s00054g280 [Orbilia oligospora ATCC 24927]|uniref:Zn(2)-C6 fungal-type domain-containing protein n=1 Tax=Arthrobotrys oligospora (strain ATCC 24927 / CBS 115.81 / DSM 1491) TaxID=756982 RepID=G1X5Y6_ARTOA|nr:hypothetical protein AOL_s00054g280 [Orbilia oligospora ATCC 24927]EGX51581.1 hypothetical protein AOL_s00054g280 [Orbilia oligospora ATCC 24927]